MSKNEFLTPAPANFIWPRCPEADQFIRDCLDRFLSHHEFADHLASRMLAETSTEFMSWVDHIVLPSHGYNPKDLFKGYGFIEDKMARCPAGVKALFHPYADLPRIIISAKTKSMSCAIHVDSISHFLSAHDLSYLIEGAPFSTYRVARIPGRNGELLAVERRGTRDYITGKKPKADDYLSGLEMWVNRPRLFKDETAGLKDTLSRAKKLATRFGTGIASVIFLEGERIYWQKRNRAGQVQKARQDALGLGWSNHDHHTFRSSRPQFPALIQVLLTFGFKKRERYYAGIDAGWGAQIMEQPEAGFIIFADVDLTPEDVSVDFSKEALPELDKPRTVGLWCALHGESILQAGMHHLEAQFDFERFKEFLNHSNLGLMNPFSDFPHLRQAFTKGESWPVVPERLERVKKEGKISMQAYEEIKIKGAVGSHLENLQRRDGFKGFNQKGVSQILRDVHPERQALNTEVGA